MVSPVRNSLDSYYAVNPLSSFSFGFTDTHIQQKSEKRKKKETILGKKRFISRNIPFEDKKNSQ